MATVTVLVHALLLCFVLLNITWLYVMLFYKIRVGVLHPCLSLRLISTCACLHCQAVANAAGGGSCETGMVAHV